MPRHAIVVCGMLLPFVLLSGASAENRFFIDNVTVPRGGTDEPIVLRADNDVAMVGFSFGLSYDKAALTATEVTTAGTLSEGAVFLEGRISPTTGQVGYGCVLAWNPVERQLAPGTGRNLARVFFDVIGTGGTSSQVRLQTVTANPDRPAECVITTVTGSSIKGAALRLVPGTVTIEDRTPRIVSLAGNEGTAGTVFDLVGDFLGEPGLQVTVCDAAADAVLQPDGRTLRVTAPACVAVGFAPVRVCTTRGCDDEANGFNYVQLETPFIRGNSNGDDSVDLSDGVFILLYKFSGGGAPPCFDAADANDDTDVDLSDAIYVFNYLFLGGTVFPPPYPDAGVDPTADDLLDCE